MIATKIPTVAIIDYQMGNLYSVKRACETVGLEPVITSDPSALMNADGVILPGVGAFGDAMDNLRRFDLIGPIKDYVSTGKPFMGICLGMQLLFTESDEFGHHKGLDLIEGSVVRFRTARASGTAIKVPHVGWQGIYRPPSKSDTLWRGTPLQELQNGENMYFVHSYYPVPVKDKFILSITTYFDQEFCSSIQQENVFAAQYHPEKSASEGLKIYNNWLFAISD